MPYFPVDDDMSFHPKILQAGNEAVGVWVRAGALCKKHATGGFVSAEAALSLGSKKVATALVRAGLWDSVPGGYRFHDWEHQAGNGDAQTEKERRDRNAARQREWRARNALRNSARDTSDDGSRAGARDVVTNGAPSPSPTLTTDNNHQTLSGPEANATTPTPDEDVVARLREKALVEADRLGIRDLASVRDWLERASDIVLNLGEAVELAADVIRRSRRPVVDADAYVITACRKKPSRIAEYAIGLDIGAVS